MVLDGSLARTTVDYLANKLAMMYPENDERFQAFLDSSMELRFDMLMSIQLATWIDSLNLDLPLEILVEALRLL